MSSSTLFKDLNISPEILQSLAEMNFSEPTPIQSKTLPKLLNPEKQDLIGLASTGTGKTAAFGIPALEKVDSANRAIQVLVMSPTRELAQQVGKEISSLGKYTSKKVVVLNGGASYLKQKSQLREGAQICVATPGRLLDLIKQGVVNLSGVHTVVLDEADEMISMGFRDAIEEILGKIPNKQTWLFSATMNQQISRVASRYLKNPLQVSLNQDQGLSPLIENVYFLVKDENKILAIQRLLMKHPEFYGLIFCQTKAEVSEVELKLRERGLAIESLHGDKRQNEREHVLRRLKMRQIKAVVATDVAARGLDVKDLTHVVNFNLPWESETYVHRSGRTGRNGQSGTSWSLISPAQLSQLKSFQRKLGFDWKKGSVPSFSESLAQRISAHFEPILKLYDSQEFLDKRTQQFSTLKDQEAYKRLLTVDPNVLTQLLILREFPQVIERDSNIEFEIRPHSGEKPFRDSRGPNRDYSRPSSFSQRQGPRDEPRTPYGKKPAWNKSPSKGVRKPHSKSFRPGAHKSKFQAEI